MALLHAFRLIAGFGMVGSIVLGFLAIRRREIARHRAWMMRGYPIGLGAGTQAMLFLFGELIIGASPTCSPGRSSWARRGR